MTTRHSYCRNCAATCGTVFEVEDGVVISHGRDQGHAVSQGFMCVKGEMAVDFLVNKEPRMIQSRKRQPDGTIIPIATADAVAEIAAKLEQIIARHGPRSLALYHGTSAYAKSLSIPVAQAFMASVGSPNLFSTYTIDSSAHWVCDGRMGMFKTARPDIEDVDLIVLAGSNPVVSHMALNSSIPINHQSRHLKAFRQRGGKLVVIDPRRTETARMADLHLQPAPGFDAEIFAALIRIVLDRGWHDGAFAARYTTNVDSLAREVAPFTPEFVAQRAGIDPAVLVTIAEYLRDARRVSVTFATGVSMSPNANTAGHLIHALNALFGGFVRAGDRLRHPGFFFPKATEEGVIPANRTWEHEPKLRSGHGQIRGEFGSSRLIDEMSMPGEGQIRVLIVLGANPVMAFGEVDRMRAALEGLELLVVLDPRVTETTELADYSLATSTQYESADFTRYPEGRFRVPFVQFAEPVVAPPSDTIHEWAFFMTLAQKLGKAAVLKSANAAIPDLVLSADREWTDEDVIRWYFEVAGLSFDEVKRHPGGMIVNAECPVVTVPASDDGARLDLCPPDLAEEIRAIARATSERGYAYRLTVRRIVETMNSAYRFSAQTKRRFAKNWLYMHPADLEREGFAEGELVDITGVHGAIRGAVKADATMRPGIVSMTHCWGALDAESDPLAEHGSHTSRLVSMQLEDVQSIDAMPMHSALPVNIRAAALIAAV